LHQVHDAPEMSVVDLGRVDNFNDSNYMMVFAPESEATHEIMNKVASAPFMKGMLCGTSGTWFLTFNVHTFILGFSWGKKMC
jgi:hypothetical protein